MFLEKKPSEEVLISQTAVTSSIFSLTEHGGAPPWLFLSVQWHSLQACRRLGVLCLLSHDSWDMLILNSLSERTCKDDISDNV